MKAGSIKTSNILLIGDLRLWGWEQCKNSKISDKNVLICSNKLDDNNDVIRIAKKLHRQGFVVKIRKHPSDKSYSFSKKQYVFSKNKSLRQDICDSDIIITNESAIPVEALFLNKAIYVYNFKSKENAWETYDNYHFIKYGLIEKKNKLDEELVLLIKTGKKLWNREKLNYFVGPIEKKNKNKTKIIKIHRIMKYLIGEIKHQFNLLFNSTNSEIEHELRKNGVVVLKNFITKKS